MRGHDPDKTFYLALPVDLNDGSISRLDIEGRASFKTEEQAVRYAALDTQAHGGEMVVFRCEPVKRAKQ